MAKNAARSDRRMFGASDERTMLKQIQMTHNAPDDRSMNVKPIILEVIKGAFNRAQSSIQCKLKRESIPNTSEAVTGTKEVLEAFAYIIQKVSCEIKCKCSAGDAHATTMTVLNMLSSYQWDAKVAIALGALAIAYGEFGLVVQLFPTDPLANYVAMLKQLPSFAQRADILVPRFEALNKLIAAMLDVTEKIMDLINLPPQFISSDQPPLSVAMETYIPNAVYWTIRSVVACATQIANSIGMSYEYTSTTEEWELSYLAHMEHKILESLEKQLVLCKYHIEDEKYKEAYNKLRDMFKSPVDNISILKHLIYEKDDIKPLRIGSTDVHIENLRDKTVLLLISDLEPNKKDLKILEQYYNDNKKSRSSRLEYEIVWIPVTDKSSWSEKVIKELRSTMPWHTLNISLKPVVIRYIKKVWKFSKKTIQLVALDDQGKIASQNAFYIYLNWGNKAFPFKSTNEGDLWKDETWNLELFLAKFEPRIQDWISQKKLICVYGGGNKVWIKDLIEKAKKAAKNHKEGVELIYVGKSTAKERKMVDIIDTIKNEELGHYLDIISMRSFWTRLESMLYSLYSQQHEKKENINQIMKEVMAVLSFDGSDQGWATMWFNSTEMIRAKGEAMVKSLDKYEHWAKDVEKNGFISALEKHLDTNKEKHHCYRLILPRDQGGIPEKVVCAECQEPMERYYMYRCCIDTKESADEAETKESTDEAESKESADEAESKESADEAESKESADEAESKESTDEANSKYDFS